MNIKATERVKVSTVFILSFLMSTVFISSFVPEAHAGFFKKNKAPVITSPGNKSVNEGSLLSFTVSATDPEGDSITYSAGGLPSGATFNVSTHVFSWTPSFSQSGTYNNVKFTAKDSKGASSSVTIAITVVNVNQPPVLTSISDQSVDEGGYLTFAMSGSDPDGDVLTYTALLPAGSTFNALTHVFTWSPTFDQAASYMAFFTVTDPSGATASAYTHIVVNNVNRAPQFDALSNQSIESGKLLTINLVATDADNDLLTYSAVGLPSGATLDSYSGAFNWAPASNQVSSYDVEFHVSDGMADVMQKITISVINGKAAISGVMASKGDREDGPDFINELGASWVRVNDLVDGKTPNPLKPPSFIQFLDDGINVIITLTHRDPNNSKQDQGYGTLADCRDGGFPYIDEDAYKAAVQAAISLVVAKDGLGNNYLDKGRQVWIQSENEVGDASQGNTQITDVCMLGGKFWHGTTDQYLTLLKATSEAVHALDPRMKVVMSGFTSSAFDSVIGNSSVDYRYDYQYSRITTMLNSPNDASYDAVDLHFYGCADDVAAKVQWLKDHMPAGKLWITTENSGPNAHGDITGFDKVSSKPIYRNCPEYLGEQGPGALPWWQTDLTGFETAQASQVDARMSACVDNGGSICLWFSLFDLDDEADVFNHLGLLDKDNIDPLRNPPRKKPAFTTYKNFLLQ